MTTSMTSTNMNLRSRLSNPIVAGILLVAYIAVVILLLLGLDRANPIFPLLSSIFFPPFILSPFVVLAVPISRPLKIVIILLLLLVIMPIIGLYDGSYLELAVQICIFAALALGLNIVVGFAGLLDLGYIAFFAIGAYLWAMFTSPVNTYVKLMGWTVPGNYLYGFIFVGVVVAAIAGILLGLPVLRLRGDYLAIVTLGFGEMIRILAQN